MTMNELSETERSLRLQVGRNIKAGRLDVAQAALESLVADKPGDPYARIDLVAVMLERGLLRASTAHLLEAASMLPDDREFISHMVRRLYFCGEIVTARACLDTLERRTEKSPSAMAEQAQLRWMLGEIPAARKLMEQAMASGINAPDPVYLHALLLQYTGEAGQAEVVLDDCLRRWPRFGEAAVTRSSLRVQTVGANHVQALQAQIERMSAKLDVPGARLGLAGFEWALFKEFDDLGRHEEAWQALERSQVQMRQIVSYDEQGQTRLTDALIRACDALGPARDAVAQEQQGPMPIFIVGMPRSGTTLLDRMLSNHSQVVSAGEINDFRRQLRWMTDIPPGGIPAMLKVLEHSADIDFARLGERYLEQTQWRADGHRYFIDKLPINIRMVPFIQRALPHAPILHLVREPMDVCFSNYKGMLGPSSAYSHDMRSLAHYFAQYQRVSMHWHNTMPGVMLDVPYAALVSDT
ncbi:tetratricopeptide repeat-containing sulfotransferase family protein, partial [Oleiagrimonas sp.]|uniref:tetratricopeptide repeat-containing sulfotransferase family protein n=1 Tax=Oleiagrimonas sp. TaxID=2010330 RepID=UPI00262C3FA2